MKEFIFILQTKAILPAKKIFRYLQVEQYIFASELHEVMKDELFALAGCSQYLRCRLIADNQSW
ncbi:MAG: hypothetical protein RBR02_04020 [Desulfuromonadaceae bacterium]|nr:hypothetical protein [Desulfuromonadaceae bacterium]